MNDEMMMMMTYLDALKIFYRFSAVLASRQKVKDGLTDRAESHGIYQSTALPNIDK
jgi:hypothetical protein